VTDVWISGVLLFRRDTKNSPEKLSGTSRNDDFLRVRKIYVSFKLKPELDIASDYAPLVPHADKGDVLGNKVFELY
jgi:hypothetical protein